MGRWLLGFLWKDLRLFAADRQAVVMSFVVPVLIASILGWLDSSASSDGFPKTVTVLVVDQDNSSVSKAVLDRMEKDSRLKVSLDPNASPESGVRQGTVSTAVVLPKGFGAAASQALAGGSKATVTLYSDPATAINGQIVTGVFIEDASGAVAKATYGDLAGSGEAPVAVHEKDAAVNDVKWSRAAHDYAGFGLQGLLFFAIESAVSLARERKQGIWKRLRAAPVPSGVFVLTRGFSSTVLAFGIILVIFGCGAALFGIRILGSGLGFLAISFTTALMAATFGLMLATAGKSETQSRSLGILAILVMLATGGAWFPLQKMPDWVQTMARYLPVRWAVEGFDGVTWRGLGLIDAAKTSGVLLVFSLVFCAIAVLRFKVTEDRT